MKILANANVTKLKIDVEAEANKRKQLAEADAYSTKQSADADAYSTQQNGTAESEKIDKIGTANAKAQKAMQEALASEQGQAAMQMAIIKMLPDLVRASASAMSNTKNLTIFDGAKGVNNMSTGSFAQTLDFIKKSTGLDVVKNLNDLADKK